MGETIALPVWSDELVERVKALFHKFSAQEISNRLKLEGIDLSRSALLAKMNRIGFEIPHGYEFRGEVKPVSVVPVEPLYVPFLELRPGMCKFECQPHATPTSEFRFCGLPARGEGEPYCAYHSGIAYRPRRQS